MEFKRTVHLKINITRRKFTYDSGKALRDGASPFYDVSRGGPLSPTGSLVVITEAHKNLALMCTELLAKHRFCEVSRTGTTRIVSV